MRTRAITDPLLESTLYAGAGIESNITFFTFDTE